MFLCIIAEAELTDRGNHIWAFGPQCAAEYLSHRHGWRINLATARRFRGTSSSTILCGYRWNTTWSAGGGYDIRMRPFSNRSQVSRNPDPGLHGIPATPQSPRGVLIGATHV